MKKNPLEKIISLSQRIKTQADHGILIIATKENEWILPWWKINFLIKNTLPVAFIDLGMSSKARKWCQDVGSVIDLPTLPEELQDKDQKKLCLAFSSFNHTLYLDPHMQVRANLKEIISHLEKDCSFLVTQNEDDETSFSYDLIGYIKTTQFLRWTLGVLSDQEMANDKASLVLPSIYNWSFENQGENLFAAIVNRKGSKSEANVREQIAIFEQKLLIKVGMFI